MLRYQHSALALVLFDMMNGFSLITVSSCSCLPSFFYLTPHALPPHNLARIRLFSVDSVPPPHVAGPSVTGRELVVDSSLSDGSLAPVLIRLAWHASGTFDKETGTGGSNYATMRFKPESEHGANNGLVSVERLFGC